MSLDTSIVIRLRDEFTSGIKHIRDGVGRLKADFKKASSSFEVAENLNAGAESLERVSQQARSLVESPLRSAMGFEKALGELKTRSGATADEMERLRGMAFSFDRFDPTAVTKSMTELARDGNKAKDVLQKIGTVLEFARAEDATDRIGEISDKLGNIQNAFKLPDLRRAANIMEKTASSTSLDFFQLAESMKQAAPAATSTGVSFESTNAILRAFAEGGLKGAEAGTAFRQVVVKLASATPKAKKALKNLGVDAIDSEGNVRDMVTVLEELDTAMKGAGSGDKAKLLKDLVGEEGFAALQIGTRFAGTGQIRKWRKEVENVNDVVGRMAKGLGDNTSSEVEKSRVQFEKLKIQIGTELMPVLTDLLKDLKPVIDDISDWVEKNPELVRQMGSFLIKTAAITAALSPMVRAMAAAQTTFGVLRATTVGPKGLVAAFNGLTTAAGKKGLTGALGKAGLAGAMAAAAFGAYELGKALREAYEDAGAHGMSRRERKKAADFYRAQGYTGERLNQKVHSTRFMANGKIVSAEGEVIQEATKAGKERQSELDSKIQRRNDLQLVRRLAANQATAGIVRGARSGNEAQVANAEAALASRGLTDAQVDRIVVAIQESRQQIKVDVQGGAREVDAGPATVGD